jgi:hypothetical protein
MAKRKAKKKPVKRKAAKRGASTTPNRIVALENALIAINQRVERIEEFLGEDLSTFHEKQPAASLTNGPQAGALVDPE